MSVFASFRRSVGLGGGSGNGESSSSSSTSPTKTKPMMATNKVTSSSVSSTDAARTQKSNADDRRTTRPLSDVFAQLILENSDGQEKASYPIRKRNTKIGRLPTNDIRIYRETVSRIHCQIVIDQRGVASLHVLNPRGVRINDADVAPSKGAQRIFELQQDDRIEIYRNFFRMHYSHPDSTRNGNDENVAPQPSLPAKNIRMSLVRTSVLPTNKVEKQATSSSSSPISSKAHRSPLKDRQSSDVPQRSQSKEAETARRKEERAAAFEKATASKPLPSRKGRRSLVFSTPKREAQLSVPWTAEPTKRPQLAALETSSRQKKLTNASPEKSTAGQEREQESVVVMEEVDLQEEEEDDEEGEEEHAIASQPAARSDVKLLSLTPLTPQAKSCSSKDTEEKAERLTQSSSPTKRVKRRSSFFGRAGVFSNWNLGFYPEERKDNKEMFEADRAGGDDEEDASDILSPVTSPNGTRILPEPRLDDEGNPRLPISLSSSGGGYSSPKRRVVSLRTATLLRQGQQAFEQQKLRSPPASPTKQTQASSDDVGGARSLMDAMRMIVSSSPRTSLAQKDDGEQSESDSLVQQHSDADDEDEIDRSLSLLDDDDDDVEEDNVARQESDVINTFEPSTRKTYKPRLSESHATLRALNNGRANVRKSRTSMPAKLVSISVVEGQHSHEDVEDLRAQWLAEQERDAREALDQNLTDGEGAAALSDQLEDHSDTDSELDDSFNGLANATEIAVLRDEIIEEAVVPEREAEHSAMPPLDEVVNEAADVFDSEPIVDLHADDDKENNSWQVVSPRRQRWTAEERDMRKARRNSELVRLAEREQEMSVTQKIGKRRLTAAPALATQRELVERKREAAERARRKNDIVAMFDQIRPKATRRLSHAVPTDESAAQSSKTKRRTTVAPTYSGAISDTTTTLIVEEERLLEDDRKNTNLVKFEQDALISNVTRKGGRRSEAAMKQCSDDSSNTGRVQRRKTAAAGFEYAESVIIVSKEEEIVESEAADEVAASPNVVFLERKPINGRRLSDMPTELDEAKKAKLSRRTTAAASFASLPSSTPTILAAEKETNVPAIETRRKTGSQSPAKRNASTDSVTLDGVENVASPAKMRSPVKRARANVEVAMLENDVESSVRKPRAAKVAAVAAIQSSPTKVTRSATSPVKKQLKPKASKASLRDQKKSGAPLPCLPLASADSRDEEEARLNTLSSSPTKQIKRATVSRAKQTNTLTAGPSARIRATMAAAKKDAMSVTTSPTKRPEEVIATEGARTTRSGRSVRKPADLGQPVTVTVQSDPVPATRVTRSRARRGAAAAT